MEIFGYDKEANEILSVIRERKPMFSKIYTAALFGIEAVLVSVETDCRNGLPMFSMVGTLSAEAKEARERVRVAIENAGYPMPPMKITVNLSPADIRKDGTAFDLPIALSVLIGLEQLSQKRCDDVLAVGELCLDGSINPVPGVLSIVGAMRDSEVKKIIVPWDNYEEASVYRDIEIFPAKTLRDAVEYLRGKVNTTDILVQKGNKKEKDFISTERKLDFSDISGHPGAKRALEIAAAGMHHILLSGPPGGGKTMLAKRLPTIMPPLSFKEQLEITKIYSVAGKQNHYKGLMKERPFQEPHHTITAVSLTGGGRIPKPGMISLSHLGILFLDELPEFKRETIEVLRQPMEEKKVTIARLHAVYTFPSSFLLVAAMNPCHCGFYPNRSKCHCTETQVRNYLSKLSRPFMDRIDMSIEVYPVTYENLQQQSVEETSAQIRERVLFARKIQEKRFTDGTTKWNSEMNPSELLKYCTLPKELKNTMKTLYEQHGMSARAYHKVIKVARTIADLDSAEDIKEKHLLEAFGYRSPEWNNEIR